MKKIIIALYVGAIICEALGAYVMPDISFAQTPCSSNSAAICNPLKDTSVTTVLNDVVNIAIPIGAVIAVIMFIYVGFLFIFAQGKPEEITKAWEWFKWVAIGTAILLGAKVIVTIIEGTLTSSGAVQPGLLPTS